MRKIGIVGGSFDPIHLGHTKIIEQAIQALSLDSVFVIPTGNNPWKDTTIASKKQRLDMLDIALANHQQVVVNTMEIEQNSTSKNYTIDTINELKKRNPTDSFYYIMGMDQASKFHLWKDAKKISEEVQLVVFERVGYKRNENIENYNFIQLKIHPTDISSSQFREGDIRVVDKKVWQYIVSNGLYLDTIISSKMSKKRYIHTLSMAKLARDIASANGLNETKVYVAGMLHDIAKEMEKEKSVEIMNTHYPTYYDKPFPIWHQWLGEYVAKNEYLIDDKEILQAVRHHTIASLHMSAIDMCIYVADKYDPSRDYDASKEIAICKKDILVGFKQCLKDSYEYLKKENRDIDPYFLEVYNKYVKGEC